MASENCPACGGNRRFGHGDDCLVERLEQAQTLLVEIMDIELRVENERGQHRLVFADEKAAGRFVRVALQANAFLKRLKEQSNG